MGETLDKFMAFAAPSSFAALQKYNDNQILRHDLAQFAKDPNYRVDPSTYANPETAIAADTHLKGLREAKQQEDAAPVLNAFAPAYRFAVGTGDFTDPESLGVLRSEGVPVPSADQMMNPFIRKGISKIGHDSQNEGDVAEIAQRTFGGENPSPSVLSRFLTEGGEKATNQLKTLADFAKQNDEISRAKGFQQWAKAGGNSPDVVKEPGLRTLMASAPYGTTAETLAKMGDLTGVIPKWEHVETGTGQGEQRQQITFDPRTGTAGAPIGQPWMPSAPKITNTLSYQGDKKGIETLMGELPKYMEGANTAVDSNGRIDKMVSLLDKGAGGTRGYARATVAPMLELMGIKSQGLTDAQLYQRLASTLAGSLRSQVVGPGPVSNYEQELLKKVSGGGGLGEDAARELLQYYKESNNRKIGIYNSTIESIHGVAPETAKVYRKIGVTEGQTSKIPAGAKSVTGPNGQKGYMVGGKVYTMDGREVK